MCVVTVQVCTDVRSDRVHAACLTCWRVTCETCGCSVWALQLMAPPFFRFDHGNNNKVGRAPAAIERGSRTPDGTQIHSSSKHACWSMHAGLYTHSSFRRGMLCASADGGSPEEQSVCLVYLVFSFGFYERGDWLDAQRNEPCAWRTPWALLWC